MTVEKIIKLSLLISIGLVLFIVESFIPFPIPWLKLGIANIVSIIALYIYGIKDAFIVAFFRVVIGSLIRGMLFNPIFFVAIGSNIMAILVMGFVKSSFSRFFSTVGVSIWGAFAYNITQIVIYYFLIIKRPEIFNLLPFFMIVTPITGFITGFVALIVIEKGKGKILF
ncbi:MAG: Gx transporter family protein [Candidatus Helarchaeota archaeon]|nr:Gx transporter family protein [Candidatus Helarchaeota archaeon]